MALAEKEANSEFASLDAMYDNLLISATEYRNKRRAIENELKKKQDETAKNAEKNAQKQTANALAQEKKLAKEKNAIQKKQFEANRANQIAQALIAGAQAVVMGFAQLGPIGGAINAGIQAGITAAQIAIIASQKFVPALAKGGIADGATLAMIGEAGKEAVLPLERNTGWIDTLAEKLNAIMQKDLLSSVAPSRPFAPVYAQPAPIVNNYNQTINAPKTPSRHEIYRDTRNLLALKG